MQAISQSLVLRGVGICEHIESLTDVCSLIQRLFIEPSTCCGYVWAKGRLPSNVPRWHMDYFELKSLKKKELQWSLMGCQQLAEHHEHCVCKLLWWKGIGEIAEKKCSVCEEIGGLDSNTLNREVIWVF